MNADAVRRLLRRRADELGLDFEQALQFYAIERFLFRLAQSSSAERFIVKGAVMLRVWDAAVARPTRDVDFLGRIDNTPEAVRAVVLECLSADVAGDGLEFFDDVDVAEKFESIVALGLVNSRMKDFYDLWMLAGRLGFHGQTIADALRATFHARGTELPRSVPVALTAAFAEQDATAAMWRAYHSRLAAAGIDAPVELASVVTAIREFAMPAASAAAAGEPFEASWAPGKGWESS